MVLDVQHAPHGLSGDDAAKLKSALRQRHRRTDRGSRDLHRRHVTTRGVRLERFRAERPGHGRRELYFELLVRLLLQVPALATLPGALKDVIVLRLAPGHLVTRADGGLIHELHRLLHAPADHHLAKVNLRLAESHVRVLTHRGHGTVIRLRGQRVARLVGESADGVDHVDGGVGGGKLRVHVPSLPRFKRPFIRCEHEGQVHRPLVRHGDVSVVDECEVFLHQFVHGAVAEVHRRRHLQRDERKQRGDFNLEGAGAGDFELDEVVVLLESDRAERDVHGGGEPWLDLHRLWEFHLEVLGLREAVLDLERLLADVLERHGSHVGAAGFPPAPREPLHAVDPPHVRALVPRGHDLGLYRLVHGTDSPAVTREGAIGDRRSAPHLLPLCVRRRLRRPRRPRHDV